MFRGRFEHTIDPKGRVSIPAKFRELLREKYDDRLIITIGLNDPCLMAFPYEEWVNVEEKVGSMSMVKKEVTAFQRLVISAAMECPIDKLGRVLIPPNLRAHAQLEKDVVFAGVLKKFEIWNKERFFEMIQKTGEHSEEMGETLAALGL
ncbi:MAG TPA: division/cell wall cluster transcriptional repressor MraZ [Thermodesulfobacteriota bacterium]|nr:division/cell wall cluster transcriptional repressor MraZ [Thermodesulfobacteriota bacterium]